jgi:hypothetical protein
MGVLVQDRGPPTAVRFYRQAVAGGHLGAMHNLAILLAKQDPANYEVVRLMQTTVAAGYQPARQALRNSPTGVAAAKKRLTRHKRQKPA